MNAGTHVRIGQGHVVYVILNVTGGVATIKSAGLTRRARPMVKRISVSSLVAVG